MKTKIKATRNPIEIDNLLKKLPKGWNDTSFINDEFDQVSWSNIENDNIYTIWVMDPKKGDTVDDELMYSLEITSSDSKVNGDTFSTKDIDIMVKYVKETVR